MQARRAKVMEETGMSEPPRDLETRAALMVKKAALETKRKQFQFTKEEVEVRRRALSATSSWLVAFCFTLAL